MKIQCQSCQAKYTIADEKVLGKVVKIRCKKCSSTIVINGNEHQPQADDGGDANAFDYANQSNEQWTVNVADGDQRTLTLAEIAAEYKSGTVNDETYCWKDGMADWLPLREIDAISGAVKAGGRMVDEVSVSPPSVAPAAAAPLFAPAASVTPAESPFSAAPAPTHNGNGNGAAALFGGGSSAAAVEHTPAAARRAGGRAQGADLFGNVEKAGGEDDVISSASNAAVAANAAAAAGVAPPVDEKLTGQRNENSVLFSLSALTDKPKDEGRNGGGGGGGGSSNRTTASADGSGLIDIRALSANMDEDSHKRKDTGARVDDIMNLSGGGAFGAALAAPILAPPPLEPVDLGVTSPMDQPKQSKTLIFAILGGCALIGIGIVAAVALTRGPAPDGKTGTAGSASAASPDGTGSVAMNDPSSPTGTGTGATTAAAGDTTPPPPGTGNAPGQTGAVNPGKTTSSSGGLAVKPPSGGNVAPPSTGEAKPTPAPTPTQPKDLGSALDDATGHKTAPAPTGGGGSTAPFDKGAAQAALGSVNVQSCKSASGPTGSGHVTITFQPDGQVQSAVVDQGPFPGTTVAGCVGGKFRGVHVPPFAGAPIRVGKSFVIN